MPDASMVCTFGLQESPPGKLIFHLWGRVEYDGVCEENARHERMVGYTACGHVAWVLACEHRPHALIAGWRDPGSVADATRLRRDTAEILGRLCKICEAHRG